MATHYDEFYEVKRPHDCKCGPTKCPQDPPQELVREPETKRTQLAKGPAMLQRPMRRRGAAVKAPTRKGKKGKRKILGKSRTRSRLGDVTASNISLQDAADFAGAVWKYGKYALAALNTEEKEAYVLVKDGATASFIQFISGIAQGSDYNQRTGDSVKVTNARVDYLLSANVTAGQNFSRLILLRDFMNQGSQPVNADIFQDTSTNSAMISSPYKSTLGDRFEVLYDTIHAQTYVSDNGIIHRRVGLGINDHFLFKGTTAATADSWQGALYVVFVTDQAVNAPKLTLSVLINFVDN